MIDPLSTGDCRAVHRELRDVLGMTVRYERAKAGALVRAHVELLTSTTGHGKDERMLLLTVDMVVRCAALELFGGDPDGEFGIALARRWFRRNGYVPPPDVAERLRVLSEHTCTSGIRPGSTCGPRGGNRMSGARPAVPPACRCERPGRAS